MKIKKVLSLVLVFMLLLSTTSAFAAVPEGTIVFGNVAYDLQALADDSFTSEILGNYRDNNNDFAYKKIGGDWVNSLNNETTPELPATITLKKGDGTTEIITVEEPTGELKVVGVSAIKQTIAKDEATDLKFEVNGEEVTKAEFDETYGEEDYTVNFLYNFEEPTNAERAGKVSKPNDFKYAVQVYLDGEKVNEVKAADYETVKVVVATEAVKVHELGLFVVGAEDKAFEHDTIVKDEDHVEIQASVLENALGQKNTDEDKDGNKIASIAKPNVKKVTSSDPTVAYYDGEIKVRKDGKVTFTVEFEEVEGKELEVLQTTIKVTTRAKQELTSVEAKDLRVKADAPQTIKLNQLDQDGNEMRTDKTVYYTSTEDGKVEAKTAKVLSGSIEFAKGNHTVKLYADADKKTELGSFAVEAVDVSDKVEIDEYKIVPVSKEEASAQYDDKDELLDLDHVTGGLKELKMLVEAYKDGIKVDLDTDVNLVAESSDKDVVTTSKVEAGKFNIIANNKDKTGEATVTLYIVEGDYKEEVATYNVEVVNTTKQIDKLTLKTDTKVIIGSDEVTNENNERVRAVIAAVNELKDGQEDHIDKVELSKNDKVVIVTIKDIYGGKEFTLDAEYVVGTVVRTEEQLRNALVGDVETIVLGDDISLTDHLDIRRSVVLDGKGNTITAVFNKVDGALIHLNADNVTIKNVTITTAEDKRMMGIDNTGRIDGLIIERVTFKDMELGFYSNGEINGKIEDCIFENLNKGIGYSHSPSFQLLFKDNIFRNIKSMYFEIFGEPSDEVVNAIIENNVFLYKDIEVAVIVDDEGNIVATEV